MYFTVYQITHKKSKKIYIGKHKTLNLYDGYMGSGKLLRFAQNKDGLDFFEKEILHVFDTEYEMNDKEAELVHEEFCLREDTYNLCKGGSGGFSYINREGLNRKNHTEETYKKVSKKLKGRSKPCNWSEEKRKLHGQKSKERNSTRQAIIAITGKPKSEEHKRKIRESVLKTISIENIVCPHCHKNGGSNIMKRWHFDRCKIKCLD